MPTMRRFVVVPVLGLVASAVLIALATFSSPHSAQGIIPPFPTPPPHGVALVVNTKSDLVDPGDGTCSLRAAIEATNANAHAGNCDASLSQAGGTDGITFDIGTGTPVIDIGSTPLPDITDRLGINGNTGGADRVELRGPGGPIQPGSNGLTIANTAPSTTMSHLVIDKSANDGVLIEATNVTLLGNFIGTDATGTTASPNQGYGVHVTGNGVRIGGATDGGPCSSDCNLISGNFHGGIFLDIGESGAVIKGNFLGPDVTGTKRFELLTFNAISGVDTEGSNDTIGGTNGTTPGGACTGDCNLISGNTRDAYIDGAATGTHVLGNFIGTDVSGSAAIGSGTGVFDAGDGVTVGGADPAARNLISGNLNVGIVIDGDITIQGNYIGTNSSGTAAIPNLTGITSMSGSTGAIGGAASGAGNLISGNNVALELQGGTGFTIQGNFIGTQADGTSPLGNTGIVAVDFATASNSLVGGTAAGEANVIAFNGQEGVRVYGSPAIGDTIRGNSIHDNGGDGIELLSGGNAGIAPALITAGSSSTASGTACANCTVDLYSDNDNEGQHYEGSVAADGSGNWTFNGSLSGPNVTATETDAAGNTSQFSAPFNIVPTPTPSPTHSPSPTVTPTPQPTETPLIWGDNDCSGVVSGADALLGLIFAAGIHAASIASGGDICIVGSRLAGPTVWGDVDCSGQIDAQDAVAILRYVAGSGQTPHADCPAIGDNVPINIG